MSGEQEVDTDALREELAQIKDAMGLHERYPTYARLWLVYGVLVGAAAAGSQYVVLQGLPGYWHAVVWFGFMGLGGLYQWVALDEFDEPGAAGTKPNVWVQVAAVFALWIVVSAAYEPATAGLDAGEQAITVFSLAVGLVGAAYAIVGESLKAYYIRRLDRWAFYLGGAWMLAYAAVMPHVAVLRTWGYAVYGGLFAIHAVGSYVVLTRAN